MWLCWTPAQIHATTYVSAAYIGARAIVPTHQQILGWHASSLSQCLAQRTALWVWVDVGE